MKIINKVFIILLFCTFGTKILLSTLEVYGDQQQQNIETTRDSDIQEKVLGRTSSRRRSFRDKMQLMLKKLRDEFCDKKAEIERLVGKINSDEGSEKYNSIVEDSQSFKKLYEYFINKKRSLEDADENIAEIMKKKEECLAELRLGNISMLRNFINFALVSGYVLDSEQKIKLDRIFLSLKTNFNAKNIDIVWQEGDEILQNYFSNLDDRIGDIRFGLKEVNLALRRLNTFYSNLLLRLGSRIALPFGFLKEIYLVSAILQNSYLPGINFVNSILTGTNFSRSILMKANFEHSNLQNAIFRKCDLSEANLSNTDASKACFTGSNLFRASLVCTNLEGAVFDYCNLKDANLNSIKASKSKFNHADLRGARLNDAILQESSFKKANCEGAFLNNATLYGANLEKANMKNSKLRNATLTSAKLIGVDLSGADLERAKLSFANLEGVNLEGTRVRGSDFFQVVGLSKEQKEYLEKNGAIKVPALQK